MKRQSASPDAAGAQYARVPRPGGPSVTIFYFHGSIRCQKCLEIERVSREAVQSFYVEELSGGRFRWQSVDFDLPENRHYLNEFNLGLPSLAVECRTHGGISRMVLSNTWEKVGVPEDLEDYVITGIEAFRAGAGLPVSSPVNP
ncbi:MAG: hypothetical protein GX608_07685 [Lentisphaerae bacterium]|nr:hypothetical protein [Lentisphaerota bacterium]